MTADRLPIKQYDPAEFADLSNIEPAIYVGVPDEVYHTIPAPSFHRIAPVVYDGASWAHYRGTLKDPSAEWEDDSTTAMKVGRALHLATLQPDVYAATVIDGPINEKTQQGYGMDTKTFKAFEADHPGCYVLPPGKVRANIEQMAEIVLQHPRMCEIMVSDCLLESTVIVDVPIGVGGVLRCKMRPDIWDMGVNMIADLKKCQNAAGPVFSRKDIGTYNYDGQAALYRWFADVAGYPLDGFAFAAVEEEARMWTPGGMLRHGVAFHELDAQSMDAARDKIEPYLVGLAECYANDEWPGYSEDIEPISSPGWKRRANGVQWD